jgi:GlpG protein
MGSATMRQIATLPDEKAAQAFVDFLLTKRIEARLEPEAGGWALWVCDEDRVAQAKEELQAFQRNPNDPRFADARGDAQRIRKEEHRKEAEAARLQVKLAARADAVGTPVWTYSLVAGCVLTFAAHAGWVTQANLQWGLFDALLAGLHITHSDIELTSPVEEALLIAPVEVEGGEYRWYRLELVGVSAVGRGEVWRLITPIFLHFGPIHLLFNLAMLVQLGGIVETRRGPWRFLLFVVTCAVVSNVAQYYLGRPQLNGYLWFKPNALFGGMSGVLYGLFGYVWMKSRFAPDLGMTLGSRTVVAMLIWLVICTTGAFGPIANGAHAAGLIFGIVVGAAPHTGRLFRSR